jgi:hypothetical protein
LTSSVFNKRYFLLPRTEIGHLRFILESYDGLAFARTLDRKIGLVEISYPDNRSEDAEGLLRALTAEIGMREVAAPEQVSPI